MPTIKTQSDLYKKQLEKFRRQFETFVPPGCFNVHAHLYRSFDAIDGLPKHIADEQDEVGWDGATTPFENQPYK